MAEKSKKKTRAEETAEIPWDELVKLKAKNPADMKKLKGYTNLLRQGYNRRIAEFERKGIYSYAADAAKKSKVKNIPVNQLTKGMSPEKARNVLLSEFAKYQQFFQAETSSLEGIRKINAEQDERIFGDSATKQTMTDEERKAYWDLYEDFMDSTTVGKTAYMTSERVQQMLAEAMFDSSEPEIEPTNRFVMGAQSAYFDEYGLTMDHLRYPKGSKLYNMYKTAYMLKRQERIEQLGRVQNERPDSPIFINGGDD